VSSAVFCSAPTPSEVAEAECFPEVVCGEVDRAPEAESIRRARSTLRVQPGDEGATVEQEPGVASDPHLQAA